MQAAYIFWGSWGKGVERNVTHRSLYKIIALVFFLCLLSLVRWRLHWIARLSSSVSWTKYYEIEFVLKLNVSFFFFLSLLYHAFSSHTRKSYIVIEIYTRDSVLYSQISLFSLRKVWFYPTREFSLLNVRTFIFLIYIIYYHEFRTRFKLLL